MIRQLQPENFHEIDLVPQAIIGRPVSYFVDSLNIRLIAGSDDFDEYEGASLLLNNDTPFALRHYSGHPENTVTIYLPREYRDVDQITMILSHIAKELHVSRSDIIWQRAYDPEL